MMTVQADNDIPNWIRTTISATPIMISGRTNGTIIKPKILRLPGNSYLAAARAAMAPCWAVMLVPESPLGLPFDGAFIHGQAVGWAARQDSKPGRAPIEAWVLHATAQWTKAHWEMPSSGVIDALCEAFAASAGISPIKVSRSTAHRWRYALPTLPTDSRCLVDSALKIGACGDWCGGPRLEGAYLSGIELARRLRG